MLKENLAPRISLLNMNPAETVRGLENSSMLKKKIKTKLKRRTPEYGCRDAKGSPCPHVAMLAPEPALPSSLCNLRKCVFEPHPLPRGSDGIFISLGDHSEQ